MQAFRPAQRSLLQACSSCTSADGCLARTASLSAVRLQRTVGIPQSAALFAVHCQYLHLLFELLYIQTGCLCLVCLAVDTRLTN